MKTKFAIETYRTTSAALSAAPQTTNVCGVPFSSDDLTKPDPLSGLNAFKNSGRQLSARDESYDDVSRKAVSASHWPTS